MGRVGERSRRNDGIKLELKMEVGRCTDWNRDYAQKKDGANLMSFLFSLNLFICFVVSCIILHSVQTLH